MNFYFGGGEWTGDIWQKLGDYNMEGNGLGGIHFKKCGGNEF